MSSADEFRKRTLVRLDSIRSHLQHAPRTSRLKGKVCIITGVGSLKGIGSVIFLYTSLTPLVFTLAATDALPHCRSHTKVPHSHNLRACNLLAVRLAPDYVAFLTPIDHVSL